MTAAHLTANEGAALTGIPARTLRRAAKLGALPSLLVGGMYLFAPQDLADYAARRGAEAGAA